MGSPFTIELNLFDFLNLFILCQSFYFFIIYLFSWGREGPHCTACGISVPQPEIEPQATAVRAQNSNHEATRELPKTFLF